MIPPGPARYAVALLGVAVFVLTLVLADGPGPPVLGAGVLLLAAGPVLFGPSREIVAAPGERAVAGEPRRGTLVVPPRRRLLSLVTLATALALVLAGAALLASGAAAVVLWVLTALPVLMVLLLVPRLARPASMALVLTPEGLGPIGADFVRWDELTAIQAVNAERDRLAAPVLRFTRADAPDLVYGSGVSPVEVTHLLPVLEALREDPGARAALTSADGAALEALRTR